MADRSRGKPPRPVIAPAVAPDEEMTVLAQTAPKRPEPAPKRSDPPKKQPDPATQQPAEEGTMMMAPSSPQTGPPPGLASTMLVQPNAGPIPQSQYAQSGANPRAQHPNQAPQSAYGPPLDGRAWMQQQQGPGNSGQMNVPTPGPQMVPMHQQMPHSVAPSTGPRMPPSMQAQQGYRAVPPPAAPPGIVLHGKPDPRLVLIAEPESSRAAGFRMLRDNLLAKRLPRVLAVSSAMKGDGKTTVCVNLGLSLSEGARVLVLDGNLADPTLNKIFLIDDATVPSAVSGPWAAPFKIAEYSPTFHVAAVVPGQTTGPVRFERRWFEGLVASLRRSHYDFIILDTAALSTAPTVSQLIATADATLLAVRAGITTARALRRASEQIPDGRAIGVALVDTKPAT